MSAIHPRRRQSTLNASLVASVAFVLLGLLLVGGDLAGSTLAAINPTSTPSTRVIDGPFIPLELPTQVPTRDVPVLGVPTESSATEEEVSVEPTTVPTEVPETEVSATEEGRHGTGSENSLTIWKLNCPEGTSSMMSEAEYAEMCHKLGRGIEFTLTSDTGVDSAFTTDDGRIGWSGVQPAADGTLSIQETLPAGFGEPQVFCSLSSDVDVAPMKAEQVPATGGRISLTLAIQVFNYTCWWYNIPTPEDGANAIELWKHYCPAGTSDALTIADYMTICAEPVPPTTFTLTDPDGSYPMTTDATGYTRWLNVSTTAGQVAIAEKLPVGYGTPQVFCEYSGQQPEQVPATNGYLHLSLVSDEFRILCQVFNIPTDDTSSLTIVKYTCPAGYDLYAPGADPGFDCQTLTDGIPFVLDDGMPGLDLGGITGDSGTGTVSFADVKPGSYTVEELVPPGMGDPFVLKCEGGSPQLQPYPLWSGNGLPITLNPGEAVFCFWYNVPAPDPDSGTLTLTKYACTTETFVSDLDCQVYEGGQVIDLLEWDGVQWDKLDTEKTDAFGRIVWTNLPIGHYLLAEQGTTWCHIESSALLGNDGSFNLNQQGGVDQTVAIYNCGFDPRTPDGTPTDWPNTGVGDMRSSMRTDASDERNVPLVEGGESATPVADRCLDADDPLATSGDVACPREAVPVTIRIGAIGVDAPIEVKETVGGQMQQPTGETAVAWYKESPRLGEPGNMLFAGHLNWWGIPEAVFFRLGDLQEGDKIVVTDASGAEWTYRVVWVRQDDTFSPPSAEVVGSTAQPSITLITCGGEWHAETGLYDKRTVVRAVLVSGPGIDG